MIVAHKTHLIERCQQRGYTLDEVMPCVVSQDGDMWSIDVDHVAYPRHQKSGFFPPTTTSSPGTELKKLLARIGITASPDCKCNTRARYMDEQEVKEPGWCEAHIDEIVGWLREAAADRGLPFLDAAGRLLVKRAIHNARRAAAS